jgi:hypothetical protein
MLRKPPLARGFVLPVDYGFDQCTSLAFADFQFNRNFAEQDVDVASKSLRFLLTSATNFSRNRS